MSSPPLILVVEDHADTRAATEAFLQISGYTTASAATGREAVSLLRAGLKPSLIVLDLMMPDMTGMAFRTTQVAQPEWANIPVIVHSAVGTAEDDAKRLGSVGFLRKPADPQALLTLIRKHLVHGE